MLAYAGRVRRVLGDHNRKGECVPDVHSGNPAEEEREIPLVRQHVPHEWFRYRTSSNDFLVRWNMNSNLSNLGEELIPVDCPKKVWECKTVRLLMVGNGKASNSYASATFSSSYKSLSLNYRASRLYGSSCSAALFLWISCYAKNSLWCFRPFPESTLLEKEKRSLRFPTSKLNSPTPHTHTRTP